MAESIKTHVLVIGGGPGGYVAAIRAGQLGLDCVLVEGDRLGGTCLIRGCIPSKALIHAAGQFHSMSQTVGESPLGISLREPPQLDFVKTIRWKEGVVDKLNGGVSALLKKAKVKTVFGWATFSDAKTCSVATSDGPISISAEHVILATGSIPIELPALPFGGSVLSSSEVLSLDYLPKSVVVVGAGYIGLELGTAFKKFGSFVTIVESCDKILPLYDEQLTRPVNTWLEREGVKLHLGATATGFREDGQKKQIRIKTREGSQIDLSVDAVFVTVGRRPRTIGWGLENMAVDLEGAFVRIDDQCRTSVRNVWAIGDLVGEPMLAHKASAQGEMVAEKIAGMARHFQPTTIPAVCFTEPEIITSGLLPSEAAAAGIDVVIGMFPFSANGRALSMEGGSDGGFVRIVARRDNHRVIGIQATGMHVAELSGQFAQALEMGSVLEDIAGTIHVHPSLGEALHESALRALGHAIHI